MSSAHCAILLAAKRTFVAGTTTPTVATPNTTTAFGGTRAIIFDRTLSVTNSKFVWSLGSYFTTAISDNICYLALENSSTSMTIIAEIAFSHPGGGWADGLLSTPIQVPGTGTYRLGCLFTTSTNSFNSVGTRTGKSQATDPGLTTVTGMTNATDGTLGLRWTEAV